MRNRKRQKRKQRCCLLKHMSDIGFTNRLAIYLVLFLAVGLACGFYLAILSIKFQYTGALACWTVVFSPIGTAVSVVLSRIVDKSRAENTGANGDGIKYAITTKKIIDCQYDDNSPPI